MIEKSKTMTDVMHFVRRNIQEMEGYVPGRQPGPGEEVVKLNTNENPYPPSNRVKETLLRELEGGLQLYPDPETRPLKEAAAALYGLDAEQVICGNGSDEILSLIMMVFVNEGDPVAYFDPSYSLYPVLCEIAGAKKTAVDLPRDVSGMIPPRVKAKVFFLTTPNAPYGFSFDNQWIADFLDTFRGVVVADEAYVDFAPHSALPLLDRYPNLIVVRSLSKSYALAGMRIGLGLASADAVFQMNKAKDSYNLNRLSQVAGVAALSDQEYLQTQVRRIVATRERFCHRLRELRFEVLPSNANFVFVLPPAGFEAEDTYHLLYEKGVLVRYFQVPKLRDGLRISIGTDAQMNLLLEILEGYVHGQTS
jgi:histidinol-phosphate aminotransferase